MRILLVWFVYMTRTQRVGLIRSTFLFATLGAPDSISRINYIYIYDQPERGSIGDALVSRSERAEICRKHNKDALALG